MSVWQCTVEFTIGHFYIVNNFLVQTSARVNDCRPYISKCCSHNVSGMVCPIHHWGRIEKNFDKLHSMSLSGWHDNS